ncbi:hypothetical protein [Nonomuraea sp. NPDC049028]|uniref:hypothetical protein n=1 Tax=Nonomuraea sp. NPDC049028 TaxID=3364348 RepID=UPI00371ABC0E
MRRAPRRALSRLEAGRTAVPDALPSAWLTVDPEGGEGERFLARWLRNAGVAWVSVDPDRVIKAAGPSGALR